MTQKEFNEKNINDLLMAADKLSEEHKEFVNGILAWLEQSADAMEAEDPNKAMKAMLPLLGILVFKFLGQYVAENMPMKEAHYNAIRGNEKRRKNIMGYWDNDFEKKLKGNVITKIEIRRNRKEDDDDIIFHLENGDSYIMFHEDDYCERVDIEDICGDINDVLNSPILLAEKVTNKTDSPRLDKYGESDDSYTWTFYKLSTIKGSVTIRWYGESNGYYSEEVNFKRLEKK
jgi:hypothetical protein